MSVVWQARITVNISVEGYVVLQYSMEYCTILVFYVRIRFELDYYDKLYCVDDMLRIYHSDP